MIKMYFKSQKVGGSKIIQKMENCYKNRMISLKIKNYTY